MFTQHGDFISLVPCSQFFGDSAPHSRESKACATTFAVLLKTPKTQPSPGVSLVLGTSKIALHAPKFHLVKVPDLTFTLGQDSCYF